MKVYNTLGRSLQDLDLGSRVGMYVCGPTVQAAPHLGHGRSAVAFDVIRRYLEWRGHDVTYVFNITDIDDKIIASAQERGVTPAAVAEESAGQFLAAYELLGMRLPDVMPRATAHIEDMVELISELVAGGHAYESGGDVYFAVRSFDGYGRLSGRDLDELMAGARVEPDERKRDPLDFALWKAAKPGEPSWPSPWGPGRPGWHIECSAMARKYLGFGFDIHGGGMDLVFPHHENEIAQAEAAAEAAPFVRVWLHNGFVNLGGEKMSKSTGLVTDLLDALEKYPPRAVRLFYLRKRYRDPLEFTEGALADAAAQLERLWAFRRRVEGTVTASPDATTMDGFREAMDDDFNTAEALAVLFEAVREGNTRLDQGTEADSLAAAYDAIAEVLGLSEPTVGYEDLRAGLESLGCDLDLSWAADETAGGIVAALVAHREEARAERDFAQADEIRDRLGELGIVIEDSADGARWHRR